jgi:hypothetical protein
MKFKVVFVFLCILAAEIARAEGPLYSVKLTSTETFEVAAGTGISIYADSEQFGIRKASERKIVAAGYVTGIVIKTKVPASAIQDVNFQIARQTGLKLLATVNAGLEQIAPTTLLLAFSETAVITLVLTPKGGDEFSLTCSYVIDERPAGSIDGTPAAIAQLEERLRRMVADSTATSLPTKIAASELKPDDYFRGAQEWTLSSPTGDTPTPVKFLLLKRGDEYTLGVYREANAVWSMIDQPVVLHGFGPPGCYGRDKLMFLRSPKTGGHGGFDFFLENDHLLKKEFTE